MKISKKHPAKLAHLSETLTLGRKDASVLEAGRFGPHEVRIFRRRSRYSEERWMPEITILDTRGRYPSASREARCALYKLAALVEIGYDGRAPINVDAYAGSLHVETDTEAEAIHVAQILHAAALELGVE